MLKLFNKIRYQLSSEGRLRRYLVYAIGEIILVVIGILLALQINNWNLDRKESAAELELYRGLLEDLKSENARIEDHLVSAKSYDTVHSYIYSESIGQANYDSSMYYNYLLWFHRYSMFVNEKYSKSLNDISNTTLHERLKNYIRQEVNTKNSVDEFNEHQLSKVRPYLSQHGINKTSTMFSESHDQFAPIINNLDLIDYPNLQRQYGTQELDQLLFSIRFKNLWMAQNFEWLLEMNRDFQLILSSEMSSTQIANSFEEVEPQTIDEFYLVGWTTQEIINLLQQEVAQKVSYGFMAEEMNDLANGLLEDDNVRDALTVYELSYALHPENSTAKHAIDSLRAH